MTKRLSIWLKQLWCALDGHGGIDNDGNCKRCGAKDVL
jgi:hypothetical protein